MLATLIAARDADPRRAPFGVLVQDPWADGEQQFFWYETRADLEFALLDAHAFVDPEAFVEDQDVWVEPRFDLDAALLEIEELTPEDAESLDDLVGDFFGIVWIGHFAALVEGEDPIALQVRDVLRRGADLDDAAEVSEAELNAAEAPIRDDELDAFVELLRDFGTD